MDKKTGFEIILNSSTPFIKKYDIEHGTGFGKFFDEFIRINCPCTFHTPSERKVLHGDKEPFFVSSLHGHLHKKTACYECMGVHGASIIEATERFVKNVVEKSNEGYLVCEGTDSSKLYNLKVTDSDVILEPYKK